MVSRWKLQPSNFHRLTIANGNYAFFNIKQDTASGATIHHRIISQFT
jgi:hypothetical protein